MKLRPYQEEAVDGIRENYSQGVNKQVLVMGTGLGKTVVFAHIISRIIKNTGKRAMILAHRGELLEQAKDKLQRIDPDLQIETEKAEQTADSDADVVVASVPSIGRESSDRIKKFNPEGFAILVVDEAHHASAKTYKKVFKHFGVLKDQTDPIQTGNNWNSNLLLLGVTATPQRNDNKGIDQVFDTVAHEYGIVAGMKDKWLSGVKAWRINTSTDLSEIKTTAGDFNQKELAEAVNTNDRNGLIVSAYKNLTKDQKALCFAVNVKHAKELSDRFNKEGIPTDFVIGASEKDNRKKILSKFSSGKLKVVVNCMVLTEGFDEPSIEVILMARPTQSGILFQQMIGRGSRLHEGKEHLTVIDFVDNTYRQKLQTTAKLIGIPGNLDFKGHDILKAKDKVDELLDVAPNTDLSEVDIENIKYAVEEVDLLSGLKVPSEISTFTYFDWHRYDKNTYKLGLGNGHTMTIKKTLTGQFVGIDSHYDKEAKRRHNITVGQWHSLEEGIKRADKYIRKEHNDSVKLVRSSAKWRNRPLSEGQEILLKKFKVNDAVLKQLDRGQAAQLISRLINSKRRWRSS